jgi:hypothetical protein
MECLLLLVDEIDDWVSTLRLHWVGLRRSIALLSTGVLGAVALLAVTAIGWAPLLLCIGAVGSSATLAFGLRQRVGASIR